MRTSAKQRFEGQAPKRASFQFSPVAAGCAALLLVIGSAHAQQAAPTPTPAPADASAKPATELDTVTVTGIRRGIESAIAVKKDNTSIVEAVSAEDIGKLPDVSIAESIARLPGLSAQRVAGRAQVISVRGLSPDFATTLLNGREIVSTGDNRSVEFDQYPSELLKGVLVYKTPDAALIGQGLSGTIDMQTVKPLDFAGRVVSLNARVSQNSLGSAANADSTGNRFSISYIDQFADRTIGISLGYAHLDTPVQEQQVGLYEPWKTDARPGLPAGTWATDGMKALRRTGSAQRDGLMGTIEFKPSKDFNSVLDLFASRAKQEDTANQWEMNTQYNGNFPCNPSCDYSNVAVNGNGTLTNGTLSGVYPLVRGMYNKREDEIRAIGWNNKLMLGEVKLVADINYSKATRDELNLENNTQLVPAPQFDNVEIGFINNGFSQMRPTLDYSDATRLFLRNTIYGSGYGKVPSVEDELKGFKFVGSVPMPVAKDFFSDISAGLNYADRSKKKRQPEGNINVGAQGDTAIAPDLQYGLVDLGFAGVGMIPSWNVPAAVARYMTFNPSSTAAPYLVAKSWDVNEKTTTGFLQANIDSDVWSGVSVRGNVGVQVVRTDQSSDAIQLTNGGTPTPVSDGKTMTDVLPSMNLAFGFKDDQFVRVALAKQMARPRVDQLRASIEVNVDDNPTNGVRNVNGSGGNPQLDPWKANAFDISYEKYWGTKAYVAAAYFYKDLDSYIYTQTNPNFDFTQFTSGIAPNPSCPTCPISPTGSYSAPTNGQGGRLSGFELSASLPFDKLTPVLSGFGVVANASFNSSNISIKDPESSSSVGPDNISLPGLSDRVYSLTAYYENGGFEARISGRKRSDFIGEIGNFNGNRTLRYVVGETIVDAQLGYNFRDGPLNGLGLLFQVTNLTNEAYQTYFAGAKDRPLEYIKWGSTYFLGANYKF
ncbi:TonB-dependent receptor [Rivibacter subsaxonicus]|uniref:TonB-dependent receptor n=1 Tax=Rivibacter subsaxonicus TaxID=457575 RepID=A0A4Q7VZQ4_9BURK|nr:TonB-dependent receptor [Rivibacter subsaxonicus]RZU01995.1 TonB-dependent receptor [Rivibacter subsaxonicus]